jgi:hypothetical protein
VNDCPQGILVLHMEALRSCLNMKVFVDTDDDLRLARRCARPLARAASASAAGAATRPLLAGRGPGERGGRLSDATPPRKRAGSARCDDRSAHPGGVEPSPCAALASGVSRARDAALQMPLMHFRVACGPPLRPCRVAADATCTCGAPARS